MASPPPRSSSGSSPTPSRSMNAASHAAASRYVSTDPICDPRWTCRPIGRTWSSPTARRSAAAASAGARPNLDAAWPVAILRWVSASMAGFTRTSTGWTRPAAAARRSIWSSSPSWSATRSPARAASAAAMSASDLLFPCTISRSPGVPAATAKASSPSEATSMPRPSSSSTRSTATVVSGRREVVIPVSCPPMANRVLVVGWDGADWEILDPLLAAGDLPNLAALAERGARGVARSVLPSHSWAAWPSFLTGVSPAGHGVFDILEHKPGQTRRMPVSSHSILAPTWPQRLSDAGRTVLLLNVPLTYPPLPVQGVVISGGVIPPKAVYSHPAEAGPELHWPINGGSWTTFRNRPLDLVADVEKVTTARAEAVRRLMDSNEWDVACAVFVSPDRIQHCLLEYVHPGHPDHARAAATPVAGRVRDVYRLLDRELGTLVERTDESDTV